jgi:hypothetical protein
MPRSIIPTFNSVFEKFRGRCYDNSRTEILELTKPLLLTTIQFKNMHIGYEHYDFDYMVILNGCKIIDIVKFTY